MEIKRQQKHQLMNTWLRFTLSVCFSGVLTTCTSQSCLNTGGSLSPYEKQLLDASPQAFVERSMADKRSRVLLFKGPIIRVGKGLIMIINTFTDTSVDDDKQVKRYY